MQFLKPIRCSNPWSGRRRFAQWQRAERADAHSAFRSF